MNLFQLTVFWLVAVLVALYVLTACVWLGVAVFRIISTDTRTPEGRKWANIERELRNIVEAPICAGAAMRKAIEAIYQELKG